MAPNPDRENEDSYNKFNEEKQEHLDQYTWKEQYNLVSLRSAFESKRFYEYFVMMGFANIFCTTFSY